MDPADETARRARAARFATVPIVLAGTIAITAGLTGPVAHADTRHDDDAHRRDVGDDHAGGDRVITGRSILRTALAKPATTVATTVAAVQRAPATYTVRQGDTVSAIADRYGLAVRDVLTRNGLGWNTIIHPGQTLHLTAATAHTASATTTTASTVSASTSSYHVVSGDTVSGIAARHGVSTSAVLAANRLQSSSVIYPGQTLSIPARGTAAVATSAPAASSGATASSGTTAAVSTAGRVTVHAGDTVATIAAAHGVSVSALLAANGLTYTSTIYAGTTLVIPAASAGLNAPQRENAEMIVSIGRSLGVSDRGLVIALAAAMQESGLRNLDHGDRDSLGLFQQRPSQGWGSAAQLMDRGYAIHAFFSGVSGKTRGLLSVPNWQRMSVTQAAQAVQNSAYPDAYAKWEKDATVWLATL